MGYHRSPARLLRWQPNPSPLPFHWITGTNRWFPSKYISKNSLILEIPKCRPFWKQQKNRSAKLSTKRSESTPFPQDKGNVIFYHIDKEPILQFCQVWVWWFLMQLLMTRKGVETRPFQGAQINYPWAGHHDAPVLSSLLHVTQFKSIYLAHTMDQTLPGSGASEMSETWSLPSRSWQAFKGGK